MLNDPTSYKIPQNNNPANRRRVIYFAVALAVLLATIPIVFLVLKGWLSPAGNADEPVIVIEAEQEEIVEDPVENIPAELPAVNLPEAGGPAMAAPEATAPESPTPAGNAATGMNGQTIVQAPITAVSTPVAPETPAAAPIIQEPPVEPVPVPAAPAPKEIAETPKNAPKPAAPKAESAKAAAKPADAGKTVAKREFKPLSSAELAKLRAANSNVSPQKKAEYNRKLYRYVRSNWSAPAASAVGNRKLKVTLEIEVAADGAISSVRVKTPSYVKAMDDSVNNLIGKLKRGKAPAPGFATGSIRIELQN